MDKVLEANLREAVRNRLRLIQQSSIEARVFEEFAIELGAARADFAVVSGQALQAIELKSDLDSFARLHNQIHAYGRVFDQVTIAVGARHLAATLAVVPAWWEIIEATQSSAGVALRPVRSGATNPAVDAFSVATLLWRDEALTLLQAQGLAPSVRRPTRMQLYEQLAAQVPLARIQHAVRERLRLRHADEVHDAAPRVGAPQNS